MIEGELWRTTPQATGLGEDAQAVRQPDATGRLGQIDVPTLVVVAQHDPQSFAEVGRTVARQVPGARLIEVESDHYLTVRQQQAIAQLLIEFLAEALNPGDR